MKTVNMHEAKTHLSKLVAEAANGEPFLIAKAGKPLVKVSPVDELKPRKLGMFAGQLTVPDEVFDPKLDAEIAELFYAEDPVLEETLDSLAKHLQAEKQRQEQK